MRRRVEVRVLCHMLLLLLVHWRMGWLWGRRDWTPRRKLVVLLGYAVILSKASSVRGDWGSHVPIGGARDGAHTLMRGAIDVVRLTCHGRLRRGRGRIPAGDGSLLSQEV